MGADLFLVGALFVGSALGCLEPFFDLLRFGIGLTNAGGEHEESFEVNCGEDREGEGVARRKTGESRYEACLVNEEGY